MNPLIESEASSDVTRHPQELEVVPVELRTSGLLEKGSIISYYSTLKCPESMRDLHKLSVDVLQDVG